MSSSLKCNNQCMICFEDITNKHEQIACSSFEHFFCIECVMKSYKDSIHFFEEIYFPTPVSTSQTTPMTETVKSILYKTCFDCKKPWEFKSWTRLLSSLDKETMKKILQMQIKHSINQSIHDKFLLKKNALVKVKCMDIFNCTGYTRHFTDNPLIIYNAIENHSPMCQAFVLATFETFIKEHVTLDFLKNLILEREPAISILAELKTINKFVAECIDIFIKLTNKSIECCEDFYFSFADAYVYYLVNLTLFPHCSRCKIPQEKSDACNHMTCEKCTAETCYVCSRHFPTMITLDQYSELKLDWKLGSLSSSFSSSAITWYDHACPIYSMKIFTDIASVLSPEKKDKIKISFPANEVEASIILRKIYFLLYIFQKKIPIRTCSLVDRLYPEFPCIPILHGYVFEIFSGSLTWQEFIEKRTIENDSSENLSLSLFDFSPFFSLAI